jgi:hypothetical protein
LLLNTAQVLCAKKKVKNQKGLPVKSK